MDKLIKHKGLPFAAALEFYCRFTFPSLRPRQVLPDLPASHHPYRSRGLLDQVRRVKVGCKRMCFSSIYSLSANILIGSTRPPLMFDFRFVPFAILISPPRRVPSTIIRWVRENELGLHATISLHHTHPSNHSWTKRRRQHGAAAPGKIRAKAKTNKKKKCHGQKPSNTHADKHENTLMTLDTTRPWSAISRGVPKLNAHAPKACCPLEKGHAKNRRSGGKEGREAEGNTSKPSVMGYDISACMRTPAFEVPPSPPPLSPQHKKAGVEKEKE